MGLNVSAEKPPQIVETSVSTEVKDLFDRALEFYKRNNFKGAVELFTNIISQNSNNIEAHVNLGNSYFKLGQVENAINSWKKALAFDSNYINCYLNIGNAYYSANNLEEAIAYWHTAVKMAPDFHKALLNLGIAYEKIGDKFFAYKYYEEYLKFCQNRDSKEYKSIYQKVSYVKKVAAHNMNAGFSFQKSGNLTKAAIAYVKSVKAYPNLEKANLNLGSICYKAEKYEHAIKYWTRAAKLDDSNEEVLFNLGIAYDRIKQYDCAYAMYARYISKVSHLNACSNRMAEIKTYLDKHPELIKKHIDIAEKFYKLKRFDKALWEYENYVFLNPDAAISCQDKINDLKHVLNPLPRAIESTYEIAKKCFEQKKYEQALMAYRRFLLLAPEGKESATAQNKIIECTRMLGKK